MWRHQSSLSAAGRPARLSHQHSTISQRNSRAKRRRGGWPLVQLCMSGAVLYVGGPQWNCHVSNVDTDRDALWKGQSTVGELAGSWATSQPSAAGHPLMTSSDWNMNVSVDMFHYFSRNHYLTTGGLKCNDVILSDKKLSWCWQIRATRLEVNQGH